MSEDASIRFTEVMKGYIAFGEEEYRRGVKIGRRERTSLKVRLTITVADFNRFANDSQHTADVTGWIHCDALGGRLPVESGSFHLFADAVETPGTLMLYRLLASDSVGHPITLVGFKAAQEKHIRDIWPDTTRLYTRVLTEHVVAGEEASAQIIATGIIHIHSLDFLQQLTTFRATGPTRTSGLFTLLRFGGFFVQHLWQIYIAHTQKARATSLSADAGQQQDEQDVEGRHGK